MKHLKQILRVDFDSQPHLGLRSAIPIAAVHPNHPERLRSAVPCRRNYFIQSPLWVGFCRLTKFHERPECADLCPLHCTFQCLLWVKQTLKSSRPAAEMSSGLNFARSGHFDRLHALVDSHLTASHFRVSDKALVVTTSERKARLVMLASCRAVPPLEQPSSSTTTR